MTDSSYEVVFTGRIAAGADIARVKANLAMLFKIELARVDALFTGKPVVIKKRLDEATARKYQAAMQKAGAVAEVVGGQVEPVRPVTPERVTRAVNTLPLDTGLMQRPVFPPDFVPGGGEPTAAAQPADFDDVTIAPPGVDLVEHREVPEPQIDTSGLSLAPQGGLLSESTDVPEPKIDISGLSVEPNA